MARYNGRLHCIVGVLPTCYKRKAATYFYPPGGTGPAVDECVTSLQDIRDGVNPLGMPRFLSLLEKDLVNGVFKGHHHISRLKHPNQFQKAKRDFIDAIIQNVQNRYMYYFCQMTQVH